MLDFDRPLYLYGLLGWCPASYSLGYPHTAA